MAQNFQYRKCIGAFQGQNDLIWDVCLHKEGLILYSGSDNGRLIAWNAETCQPIGSMVCQGSVTQIESKRLVVIAAGDRVIVTEVMPNGMFAPVKFATVPVINPTVPPNRPGHIIGVVSMFVEDVHMFVGYADGFIRLWTQGKLAREYKVHNGVVMTIVKDGDTVFSGGQDQSVYAMDARDGQPFALYRGQHGPIRAINVYNNKLCIATGNAIRVQTVDQGELLQRLCGHTHPIFSLLRDRNLLYSGAGDRKVFVWNLDTLWPIMEIHTGHQGRIKSMALSPRGILFTGSSDKIIKKFDMKDAFNNLEEFKKLNPNATQPPNRANATDGKGTMTAGMNARASAIQMKPLNPGIAPAGVNANNMTLADLALMLPDMPSSTTANNNNNNNNNSSSNSGGGLRRGNSASNLPAPPSSQPSNEPNRAQSMPSSRQQQLIQQQTNASMAELEERRQGGPPPIAPRVFVGAEDTTQQQYGNLQLVTDGHGVASSGLVPNDSGGYEALRPLPAFPVEAMQSNEPPAPSGFTCEQCGNIYASASDLQVHTDKRHGSGIANAAYSTEAPQGSYISIPAFSANDYQNLPAEQHW